MLVSDLNTKYPVLLVVINTVDVPFNGSQSRTSNGEEDSEPSLKDASTNSSKFI